MNSKDAGNLSEAMILAALVRAGYAVLRPFGDNLRYDLAIDKGGTFLRVQCTTGYFVNGTIGFPVSSSQAHRGHGRQGYKGQADLFAVYYPLLNKVYVIPVDACGRGHCRLRIEPPKNNQKKRVRYAKDYEV